MKKFLSNVAKNAKGHTGAIVFGLALMLVAFAFRVSVLNGHENNVRFEKEYVKPGYETIPATYYVQVSQHKAWELTHTTGGGRFSKAVAVFFFYGAIALLVCGTLGIVEFKKPIFNTLTVGAAVVLWAVFNFAAYSSAYANTFKFVSVEQYEAAKASPEGLDGMFKQPI